MLGPDPILDLVRSMRAGAAPADDSAVRRALPPTADTIGPQPQHARVAPVTYHGLAGALASLGNQAADHPIKTALSVGAMALPGALEAAPELAALIRGGAEAAPAADAELAARNFYSTLPGLTQRGAAMSPATHARAVESLMSALPKAANAAAPGDDWTALLHPAAADAYAGARPAAESMEIPASLNTGALADSVVAHVPDLTDRFRDILNATADAGKYKPSPAERGAAEMQRRAYSLFQ